MVYKMDEKQRLLNIAYSAYLFGFVPIPLRGKIPRVRRWQKLRNKPVDQMDIASGKYPSKVRLIQHLIDENVEVDNIGVLTGEPSGIVVLDIDARDNGIQKWNDLVEANGGVLPKTFVVSTGGEGYHYYFKYNPSLQKIKNRNGILGMPLDFRTNGGMVVFPGSKSKSGNVYAIYDGYENERPIIADIPPWLISILVLDSLYKRGITNPTAEQFNQGKLNLGFR